MKALLISVVIGVLIISAISAHYLSIYVIEGEEFINKYSFYVHLSTDWNSYPTNIFFDVTDVWTKTDSFQELPQKKQNGVDEVKHIHEKSFIEVTHDTSCSDRWEPHYARQGADILRQQIEFISGEQEKTGSSFEKFSLVSNENYSLSEHDEKLLSGFSQFIPICTSKKSTSYEYSIKIHDKKTAFDVFFIPSIDEQIKYIQDPNSFTFYDSPDCYGRNFQSFSGKCENISSDAGLLIVIPDEMTLAMTKITVNLHELT